VTNWSFRKPKGQFERLPESGPAVNGPHLLVCLRTHTNFSSGAFGRITSMEGTPRIVRFGVKYGF